MQHDFWAAIDVKDSESCWLWRKNCDTTRYHSTTYKGVRNKVHRIAYELYHNCCILKPYEIDHTCRVKACVNPHHLELVTHKENQRRWRETFDNKKFGHKNTHCKRGHLYTDSTTRFNKRGRACRVCDAENARRYRRTKKAALNGP